MSETTSNESADLRRKAEKLLVNIGTKALMSGPAEDSLRLIHELQVHQIELEMQNAELLQARNVTEYSLDRYTELFDFAPVGYVTLDRNGTILTANLTGSDLFCVERSRLIGRRFGSFVSGNVRASFVDFLEKVFVSLAKVECEVTLLRKGSSELTLQIVGMASSSKEECLLALIDITDRKQTENALKELNANLEERIVERTAQLASANELWERTFDSVPDLIAILDNQHQVLRVNEAMARRLKCPPEECVGLSCHEVVHGTSGPPEFCPHLRTIMDGLVHTEELYVDRFCGSFEVTTTPILDVKGERIGSVHISHDITERKQLEETLKKLNEELENRVKERTAELRDKDQILLIQSRQAAMGEMLGNIAHQWRQPLNNLGITVQMLPLLNGVGELTKEFLDQNVSKSMNIIQHMSETIDDFRNFFRPDKEKVNFKVSDVIKNTLSLIEDSFKSQKIHIEVTAKHDPAINGYPNEYAQVLLNILNNARDALIEKEIEDPRIMVSICTEGDRAVVTISDNAGGIPEEIMDKIFDPYFTTKGPHSGTGVGLFMLKSIIEKNMDGRLAVCNITNGAEFRIEV